MELDLWARTEAGPYRPPEQLVWLHRTVGVLGETFAAVADGSGQGYGHLATAVTLTSVMERVASFLPDAGCSEPAPDVRVREGLLLANQRILDRAAREPRWRGTVVSVVVAHVRGERLGLTHVGNARAYRLREGVLEQLTEDHSLANAWRRKGQPLPEDSARHLEHVLERFVGATGEGLEVDERRDRVMPGDVYVLCSRALHLLLDEARMASVLRRRDADARSLGEELLSLAEAQRGARGEWANLAVAVLRVLGTAR
jgi:protein phosphatase